MRLFHTKELRMQEFSSINVPPYAILSHTWGDEEITLQQLESQTFIHNKGYYKILNCCVRAARDGFSWVWVDTCCIDKTSSAELSEAINSMYTWYNHSAICYAYLADVQARSEFVKSKWFTRGWTLQELIAPGQVIFLDRQWRELGSKVSLLEQISSITNIPTAVLRGRPPSSCNIAQRMSWASTRQTTREEDIAYCLLGLFNVHLPPIYGEGSERAFLRLQEQILSQSTDQTLFLWTPSHDPYNLGLLATSPRAFCNHDYCLRWIAGGKAVPRRPSDLYSMLIPRSKPLDTFDGHSGTGYGTFADPPSASLGASGLRTSLLRYTARRSDDRGSESDESTVDDQDTFSTRTFRICFDVMIKGSDLRLRKIYIGLQSDTLFEDTRNFRPDRIGEMRRVTFKHPDSQYVTSSPRCFFKRQPITISQVSIGTPEPAYPVTFCFNFKEQKALIHETTLLSRGVYSRMLVDPGERFKCVGGFASLQHSCTRCKRGLEYVFAFGVRGRNCDSWCCTRFRSAEQDKAGNHSISDVDIFENERLMNNRHGGYCSITMKCGRKVTADIQYDSEEDYFVISISV